MIVGDQKARTRTVFYPLHVHSSFQPADFLTR
jgi:hypothetical protein